LLASQLIAPRTKIISCPIASTAVSIAPGRELNAQTKRIWPEAQFVQSTRSRHGVDILVECPCANV